MKSLVWFLSFLCCWLESGRVCSGIQAAGPAGIEGIHSTFLDEVGTGVGISWLSSATNPPVVRYGISPSALNLKQEVVATVPLDGVPVHQARLTGLKPGTQYYYQCVMGSAAVTSRVCSFKTAPLPGQSVTFAVLGDIQVKGRDAGWRKAAGWLAGRKLDFCVSLGDQVDKGFLLEQWRGLFADGAPLFESMVFMPLLGNHDGSENANGKELGPTLYLKLFQLPDNGLPAFAGQWYAFNAGAAAFTMLAAYPARDGMPVDVRKAPEQTDWLDKTLAGQRATGWKFVSFHPPVYSTAPHGGDTVWFNGLWGSIMERHGVNVVFNGHTHGFEITHPLRQGKRVADGSGIIYYNGAGITYSSLATSNEFTAACQVREREPLVLIVTATAERLTLSTWNMAENTVVHEQVITR